MASNIDVDLALAFDLPPEEAIRFLEKKGYVFTFGWRELLTESISQSFTVAGVLKLEVLSSIHDLINEAARDGDAFEQFRSKAEAKLQQVGFSGDQQVTDPKTGRTKLVRLTPSRLDNIFRTNIQSAYNADRYIQQQEIATRQPGTLFLRYNAIRDKRTRPEHLALDGFIAPVEDPIWKKIYPPNGFRCRCSVSMLTLSQMRRYGLTVSRSVPQFDGQQVEPDEGFGQAPTKEYTPDLSKYPKELQDAYKREQR